MSSDVGELQDSARQVVGGLELAANEQTTWTLIAELGWLMISTPEDLGGLGMGLAGTCALQTELGRGLATIPFLPAVLAIEAVCQGALSDRDAWLERLTTGEDYVAASLLASTCKLTPDGNGALKITGMAVAVQSADRASHVLVCDDDCVALVPLKQQGVKLIFRPTWDETRRLFDVQFDTVMLDESLILARGSAAQALTTRLATIRDFALAAESVGGAAALLEQTVEYLGTRSQFGRPLALFQALKHRCADLKAQLEGAEALLLDSVGKAGEFEFPQQAELAGKAVKQLACTAFATVAEEALQLHGGIGMTSEHSCHLFLKRAMLNEHLGRQQESYFSDLAANLLGDT